MLMTSEKLKTCLLCRGKGSRVGRGRSLPPVAMCDGKTDCLWYRVLIPFDAWQALPRPSEAVLEVVKNIQTISRHWREHKYRISQADLAKWVARLKVIAGPSAPDDTCSGCGDVLDPHVARYGECCPQGEPSKPAPAESCWRDRCESLESALDRLQCERTDRDHPDVQQACELLDGWRDKSTGPCILPPSTEVWVDPKNDHWGQKVYVNPDDGPDRCDGYVKAVVVHGAPTNTAQDAGGEHGRLCSHCGATEPECTRQWGNKYLKTWKCNKCDEWNDARPRPSEAKRLVAEIRREAHRHTTVMNEKLECWSKRIESLVMPPHAPGEVWVSPAGSRPMVFASREAHSKWYRENAISGAADENGRDLFEAVRVPVHGAPETKEACDNCGLYASVIGLCKECAATPEGICHICRWPTDRPGKSFCSAPHSPDPDCNDCPLHEEVIRLRGYIRERDEFEQRAIRAEERCSEAGDTIDRLRDELGRWEPPGKDLDCADGGAVRCQGCGEEVGSYLALWGECCAFPDGPAEVWVRWPSGAHKGNLYVVTLIEETIRLGDLPGYCWVRVPVHGAPIAQDAGKCDDCPLHEEVLRLRKYTRERDEFEQRALRAEKNGRLAGDTIDRLRDELGRWEQQEDKYCCSYHESGGTLGESCGGDQAPRLPRSDVAECAGTVHSLSQLEVRGDEIVCPKCSPPQDTAGDDETCADCTLKQVCVTYKRGEGALYGGVECCDYKAPPAPELPPVTEWHDCCTTEQAREAMGKGEVPVCPKCGKRKDWFSKNRGDLSSCDCIPWVGKQNWLCYCAKNTPCRVCGELPYWTTGGLDHINGPVCEQKQTSAEDMPFRKPHTPSEWLSRNEVKDDKEGTAATGNECSEKDEGKNTDEQPNSPDTRRGESNPDQVGATVAFTSSEAEREMAEKLPCQECAEYPEFEGKANCACGTILTPTEWLKENKEESVKCGHIQDYAPPHSSDVVVEVVGKKHMMQCRECGYTETKSVDPTLELLWYCPHCCKETQWREEFPTPPPDELPRCPKCGKREHFYSIQRGEDMYECDCKQDYWRTRDEWLLFCAENTPCRECKDKPVTKEPTLCPQCDSTNVSSERYEQKFAYGVGDNKTELNAHVPLLTCNDCKFQYFYDEAEKIRHEVVCGHLGVLAPAEIRAIRKKHDLSRQAFSKLTSLGEAILARWESGAYIQSAANDKYLRLLQIQTNVEALQGVEKGSKEGWESNRST